MIKWYSIILAVLVITSCGNEESTKQQPVTPIDENKLKQQFVKANQQLVQKENDDMDYYVKNHQLPFVKTNSGIRYYIYNSSAKGDSIKEGDIVTMNYTVSLLDGTVCYSSKTEGSKTIKVEQSQLESGVHRGIQFLKKGDKAMLLIPSHLAHGLLGDMNKIPPQMPIMYDIEILEVKKESLNPI